jgi:hypothetical protein
LNTQPLSSEPTTLVKRFARHRGLLILLAVVACFHAVVIYAAPDTGFYGDEGGYLKRAYQDARNGDTSLLPGSLRFAWHPELASRFYSRFAGLDISPAALARRVSVVHLLMFLALLVAMYAQALWLGLGRASAVLACAWLGLFPWFGFYIHALWPEVLHAFFFGLGLATIQAYLVKWHWPWLLVSGPCLAYAIFAKGSINLLMPMLLAVVVGATYLRFRASPARERAWRMAVAFAALSCTLAAVLAPQLVHNLRAGHGMRLAANRWVNLDQGLTEPRPSQKVKSHFWRDYFAQGGDLEKREQRSRQKVMQHLRSTTALELLSAQSEKLADMITRKPSSLEWAQETSRWGGEPPAWLRAMNLPARFMWYGLLTLGLFGVGIRFHSSAGWALLSLVVAYFLAGLFAIPVKTRFAMPLVPILCLFAAAAVEWLVERATGLRRDDPSAAA